MALGKIISYSLYGVTIGAAAFGGFMFGQSLEPQKDVNNPKVTTAPPSPPVQAPKVQNPPQPPAPKTADAPPPTQPLPIPPGPVVTPKQPSPPQTTVTKTPPPPAVAPPADTANNPAMLDQQGLNNKLAAIDKKAPDPKVISQPLNDTGNTNPLTPTDPDPKITDDTGPTGQLPKLKTVPVTVNRCRPLGKRNTALAPHLGLKEMIGQMIIIGFQGKSANNGWAQTVAGQLRKGTAGGVLFLRHNIGSRADVAGLTRLFRSQRTKLPPLLMIDQEGGLVQRLGPAVGIAKIPRAATVARTRTTRAATSLYARVNRDVKRLGFNVNLGPVSDVNINPKNPIIARFGRAYSADPAKVAEYGRAFVNGAHAHGVVTSLKHFPGHGSSTRDSHKGFVDITKTWKPDRELASFKGLIKAGCADMVMIGHLVLRNHQDTKGRVDPATFSKTIVTKTLRGQLGYRGVVVSDDMDMGAIRKFYRADEALIRAVDAGIDLLLVSNTAKPTKTRAQWAVNVLYQRAQKSPAFEKKIRAAYGRILALKQRLRSTPPPPVVAKQKTATQLPISKKIITTDPPEITPQNTLPPPPVQKPKPRNFVNETR